MAGERDAEIPGRMLINDGNVEVQSHNGQKVLFIPKESSLSMTPLMKTNNYLPEQYTLEFDIISNGDTYEYLDLYFRKPEHADLRWNGTSNYYIRLNGISTSQATVDFTIHLPDGGNAGGYRKFADEAINEKKDNWRKIALYVNKNIGKLYVDQHRVAVVNRITPGAGMVTFEFKNYDGPMMIKNVRIAAGGADAYNKLVSDGKFIAYGIQFDINKSTIKPESMGTLNEILKMLKENTDLKFEIGGHTDSDGTAERNNQLSQERAEAVKKQLENMGVARERLTAKGYGSSKPLADNNSAENKAKNRRVEFIKK
jgi:outer membrane protein OmpA-like peptidoglycan-associated protein